MLNVKLSRTDEGYETNERCAYGLRCIGGGEAAGTTLCAVIGRSYQNSLQDFLKKFQCCEIARGGHFQHLLYEVGDVLSNQSNLHAHQLSPRPVTFQQQTSTGWLSSIFKLPSSSDVLEWYCFSNN